MLFLAGVLEESKQWLAPFLANNKLRKAFFDYTKSPKPYEMLNNLSTYVSVGMKYSYEELA